MLFLHFYKVRPEGYNSFYTYEQNPDKASVYQHTQIVAQVLCPIFFYKSQLYKFCTQTTK